MFSAKQTVITICVVLCSVYLYYKISPNIPDPNKGVVFYYEWRNQSPFALDLTEEFPAFSNGQEVFLIIPGYTESSTRHWVWVMTKALLKARPSSLVVAVDHWNYLTLSRPFMAMNVGKIGKIVADFLSGLENKAGLRLSAVHVIGFSLGGWVAARISNSLPEGKKIRRITAIDPSFPWKQTGDKDEYLDSSDAEMVVVIRTSRVSVKVPPVDFDFSVNGGQVQPHCDIWWYPDFVQQICSHYEAPHLFVSRLLEDKNSFSACLCATRESLLQELCSCDVRNSFGLNTIESFKGNFYLETSGRSVMEENEEHK